MTAGYRDNAEQLAAELDRLDQLIRRRLSAPEQAAAARAAYVTREEVEELLGGGHGSGSGGDRELDALDAEIETRVAHGLAEGTWLALPVLGRLFGLSAAELQAVVVCLAPELRRGYDRVYAYLQDDITRKRPSADLVLRLLWPDERRRWAARELLCDTAPLLRASILRPVGDPHSPSGCTDLARFLTLDPRITAFLLGSQQLDASLRGLVRFHSPVDGDAPPALAEGMLRLTAHHWSGEDRPALVFRMHGPGDTADLAGAVCAGLGVPLLDLDAGELGGEPEELLRAFFREGLLLRAGVHLAAPEALPPAARRTLRTAVADFGWLVFLGGDSGWAEFPGTVAHSVTVPAPDPGRLAAVWRAALDEHTPDPAAWAAELAGRFRLPPRRVRAAVSLAAARRLMEGEAAGLTLAHVTAACRADSARRLGDLAVTVEPRSRWTDLVLPPDRLELLADIRDQIRHRHRVQAEWGFGTRSPQGLSALFSGPSGTGKTLAAEVIAADLGLDLLKVDLSGVVSKYVGETEKNLARVFSEARACDAVLFFDEADALFGKRTEVSDAHDRYANIETSYLLQRLEEHDGPVILATNLRQNLDEAFTRRLRFVVEFPFPEAADRLLIWRGLIPPRAPVADTVDLPLLAREFPVSGGSIRNIVLNAAFLAAADGGVIDQRHLLRGTRREYEKIGRLWSAPC